VGRGEKEVGCGREKLNGLANVKRPDSEEIKVTNPLMGLIWASQIEKKKVERLRENDRQLRALQAVMSAYRQKRERKVRGTS